MSEKADICIPPCSNRSEWREWLSINGGKCSECWLCVKRGRPEREDVFYYLDAVEEALCFGWIDSTVREIDGVRMQRFSPRRSKSLWSELNLERVRRLEKLGLMTDTGRAVLPDMTQPFVIDREIEKALRDQRCWTAFRRFPPLYQRIRVYNVVFYRKHSPGLYHKALSHLLSQTKKGRMYGEWNDWGRLLDY